MQRWSMLPLISFVIAFASLTFAQQPANPGQVLSSDLVQWSYMQQPQTPEQNQPSRPTPTPDPRPETQPAQNPTPPQSGAPTQNPTPGTTPESQSQAPPAQIFTGIINKEAESFILKVSETTSYKLDNQEEVQQYEGKHVRITGTLDSSVNLIHVDKVEPLP